MKTLLFALGAAVMTFAPLWTGAQTYPERTVTLVSTAPAGGSIDAVARIVASGLSSALGQSVIVEPRPGAGGNIAAAYVAKAAPDGHTLLITSSSTLTSNPHIYKSLPFDAENSFTPIVIPARINLILVVHPKLNVSSLGEFIALLKAQPGRLNYASGGVGNVSHLAAEIFAKQTGTRANHIPYKGVGPAMTELGAGQTDFMFDSATSVPHVTGGRLRALAVVGPERVAALPQVRTLAEEGMSEMEVANGYYAILTTAGTSPAIVRRLNAEIVKVLREPSQMEKIRSIGLEPATSTPEELATLLRETSRVLGPVIRDAGITAQ